ncbi:hypothetical protein ACHAXT_011715 [Thalassiosira profunda]
MAAAAPPPPYRAALLVAPTKSALGPLLASEIVSMYAARDRDTFSIALSGGSLPALLRDLPAAFANAGVDPQWERWHVLLADERCVPSSSEDSNLGAIRRNFAEAVPIPAGQVYGIDEGLLGGLTEKVAVEYEARALRPLLERCGGMLDCAVLGFGPDGHTCSLFPNHPLLDERTRLVAPIDDSPKPPPSRITLTFPVLNSLCRKVIVCGAGKSKQPILKAVFERLVANPLDSNDEGERAYAVEMVDLAPYPCGMVRPGGSEALVWVADADAAEALVGEPSAER